MTSIIKFEKGKYPYKYTAILSNRKHVSFGHQDYKHYKDSVPKKLGGGIWSHLDHLDLKRRASYHARHSNIKTLNGQYAINVKYSPAWFSMKYLW